MIAAMEQAQHVQRAFEVVLPRLAAAYHSGKLVPFIGAGMSVPRAVGWQTLVEGLEACLPNRETRSSSAKPKPEELIRRANAASRALRAGGPGKFVVALRDSLFDPGSPGIPNQTLALAQLWWPLVLTTNYDNLYEAAFLRTHAERRLDVYGRSVSDCQRVLTSLSEPSDAVLWALQGYLNAPEELASKELAHELVLGHDEYRRVTHREPHFRRAFAEVYRNRSLLFLGSGLRESYLQELLGEVLEFYGPASRNHFAFLPAGEVDVNFLRARFQIEVLEYPKRKHEFVRNWLEQLRAFVEHQARRPIGWVFGVGRDGDRFPSEAQFEVQRSPLPAVLAEGECIAVSAGGRLGSFHLSKTISTFLRSDFGLSSAPSEWSERGKYLRFDAGKRVWAVRARGDGDQRVLAEIGRAATALFEACASREFRTLHLQLLSAGGEEEPTAHTPDYQVKNFTNRFAFVQITRAWAAWRREHPHVDLRLVMHLIQPEVYSEIASGRLDVLELLTCEDLRFWVEVRWSEAEIERRLFQLASTQPLRAVLATLNLPAPGWTFRIVPWGDPRYAQALSVSDSLDCTLEELSLVPGATLRFERVGSTG